MTNPKWEIGPVKVSVGSVEPHWCDRQVADQVGLESFQSAP